MKFAILITALLIGGCGAERRLRPAVGESLPAKPALAPAPPEVAELLRVPPTVRPGRTDELLTRSQPRAEDRFDLPPQ